MRVEERTGTEGSVTCDYGVELVSGWSRGRGSRRAGDWGREEKKKRENERRRKHRNHKQNDETLVISTHYHTISYKEARRNGRVRLHVVEGEVGEE
jgi:hypothetical protein